MSVIYRFFAWLAARRAALAATGTSLGAGLLLGALAVTGCAGCGDAGERSKPRVDLNFNEGFDRLNNRIESHEKRLETNERLASERDSRLKALGSQPSPQMFTADDVRRRVIADRIEQDAIRGTAAQRKALEDE